MQSEWVLKNLIIEIGKRIWSRGYVAANDGNITIKLNEKEILTTPTGVSKGFMTHDMILKVDYAGNLLTGNSKYKPSSEMKMHLEIYKERPDVSSVVHAHPPYCTSFAVAGIPLDKCVLPEAIIVIGAVPIAKYGLPSTMEVPDSIRPHIKSSDAILLENHGAITLGTDLLNAYYKMETLEHTANIVWNAMQLGNLNVLPEYERDRLLALRNNYNLQGRVNVCDSSSSRNIDKKNMLSNRKLVHDKITEDSIEKITQEILKKLKADKSE
ncbi:MAG: class II aldolase/adducin family protein [Melioribacteraceae bacterium]|nr:class II aldolase/adducin family protein [Melioribacteraceae bacterium]